MSSEAPIPALPGATGREQLGDSRAARATPRAAPRSEVFGPSGWGGAAPTPKGAGYRLGEGQELEREDSVVLGFGARIYFLGEEMRLENGTVPGVDRPETVCSLFIPHRTGSNWGLA